MLSIPGPFRNSAERAYHIPLLILATACKITIGSKLSTSIRPMLIDQNAKPISLSFHFWIRYMFRSVNKMSPMPSIPYTPNKAPWVCAEVVFKPWIYYNASGGLMIKPKIRAPKKFQNTTATRQ